MNLKFRYEDGYQTIEIETEEVAQWVSLELEEDLPEEEKEELLQKRVEELFNRPEYNIWHRETRHIDPDPKRRRMDGKPGYLRRKSEDPTFNIWDYLLTTEDVWTPDYTDEYEEVCSRIRKTLAKKPEWAEAAIAVWLNDEPIREYAARTGQSENSVTQKLKRAAKKLREIYKNRQF